MTLNDVDLTEAVRSLATANTPLFLIRRLKIDAAIRSISEGVSDDEILNGLRVVLDVGPTNPLNTVRPYAYLAALWMKPRPDALRAAVAMNANRWFWYQFMASYLMETYSPISTQTVLAPNRTVPLAVPASAIPASKIILTP
jgi:hypothetical protein